MRTRFEIAAASLLITTGTAMILYAIFQGYFHTEELTVFVESTRKKGIVELEAPGYHFAWLFTLLTELIGGFFLASIGTKMIKK